MESIEIKNFLTIEYAHFEIKKINILIGEQAQGKSIIAKLVYFFREFLSDIYFQSAINIRPEHNFEKEALNRFREYFPSYAWIKQNFEIVCIINKSKIKLVNSNVKELQLILSTDLIKIHNHLTKEYQMLSSKYGVTATAYEEFQDILEKYIFNTDLKTTFQASIFICAGRIFFPNIQKNIFSLLTGNIEIDPFLKKFGSTYETAKRLYYQDDIYFDIGLKNKLNDLIETIIKGKYTHFSNEDWIESENGKINLYNASSGQQESLPMLIILLTMSFLSFKNKRPLQFFIEEPEAHLFPTSQKQIISLIATIYNAFGHSFFITTHSPYILTAINNLVVGKDAFDKANGDTDKLKKLANVFAFDELIRLEDVSAYTLNNGKLESIINLENRIIGANLLDAVSDEFDEAFGVATTILYGDE